MIVNRLGAEYCYDDVIYHIGDPVIATPESEYEGLYGIITEIRDGDDQETENDTPDIYCRFDLPVLPCERKELEERFSKLYGMPKTVDEIILDMVIMAPEMIRVIDEIPEPVPQAKVYLVSEDWAANDDYGSSLSVAYTEFETAKRKMIELLEDEQSEGCIHMWKDRDDFIEDSTPTSYECYIEGEYCSSHYHVEIIEQPVCASQGFIREIADLYRISCQIEDFLSQVSDWDELEQLSDEQYERLIHDPRIPERFQKALGNNDSYWESYWETMSEVAHALVNEYLKENAHSGPDADTDAKGGQ